MLTATDKISIFTRSENGTVKSKKLRVGNLPKRMPTAEIWARKDKSQAYSIVSTVLADK